MARRFAEAALKWRLQARTSLREVARALELTPAYISDIERGNRNAPAPEIARRWAKVIGANADEFERLARLDRRAIELPVDQENPEAVRNELALALARGWEEWNEEDIQRILDAVNGGQRHVRRATGGADGCAP